MYKMDKMDKTYREETAQVESSSASTSCYHLFTQGQFANRNTYRPWRPFVVAFDEGPNCR
jgi:hypothetical protein